MNDDIDSTTFGAQQLLRAYRSREPLPAAPFEQLDVEGAYAIQARVGSMLGRAAGWKIGRDGAGGLLRARLFEPLCLHSPTWLRRRDFNLCLVECELAVVFARDLPPRIEPYDLSEIEVAIDSLHAAVEIVDSRFRDWPDVAPNWLLADGLSHGAFVLGSGIEVAELALMNRSAYSLQIDGEATAEGCGDHPAGDPANILVWLVNVLAQEDAGIRAGDIVTTGTFTGATPVTAGQCVRVCFDGIGDVRVDIV